MEISKVLLDEIVCLIIGTTSFINAAVEQDARYLKKVDILRVSKSFLCEIPHSLNPLPDLAKLCDGYPVMLEGSPSMGVRKVRSTRIRYWSIAER